jgi:hypothetical protein
VNTRRYGGARLTRHCVSASRIAGMISAYSTGSRITTGSSQTAYTSFTTPAGSPARLVSSTVTAPQASSAANSASWPAENRNAAAATPVHARSAQITSTTNARSRGGSDQTGQSRTRGMPWPGRRPGRLLRAKRIERSP